MCVCVLGTNDLNDNGYSKDFLFRGFITFILNYLAFPIIMPLLSSSIIAEIELVLFSVRVLCCLSCCLSLIWALDGLLRLLSPFPRPSTDEGA